MLNIQLSPFYRKSVRFIGDSVFAYTNPESLQLSHIEPLCSPLICKHHLWHQISCSNAVFLSKKNGNVGFCKNHKSYSFFIIIYACIIYVMQ